ncbi:helix-turn-helix transcriptional regulator [Pseudomonas sp. 18175]|uniref:helix-turn-helix transcriptional regulator n=1 Tax=Pseudomonas sp. 18175 TaxID=3390056 RepID=UPI003D1E2BBB
MSTTQQAVPSAASVLSFQPPLPGVPLCGFLRQVQVLALIPVSKSTLWRRVQAGSFPAPLKLSERVTVWRAEDVQAWMQAQGGDSSFNQTRSG